MIKVWNRNITHINHAPGTLCLTILIHVTQIGSYISIILYLNGSVHKIYTFELLTQMSNNPKVIGSVKDSIHRIYSGSGCSGQWWCVLHLMAFFPVN